MAPNQLIREHSPYLQQHAHNPVEWFPWGEDAFRKAAAEQKPVFLSIGYSTCHWCHVMERESFESPAIAGLLNRWFVSIKVDREEHPDIDHVYMSAVTALTGQGGWPLTVFLTPEGKPFFGGTYFPPERRWNVPGMQDVLPAVAKAWAEQRQDIVASAERLTAALRPVPVGGASTVDVAVLEQAVDAARNAFDPDRGGFSPAPKFPRPHELTFLLHAYDRFRAPDLLGMVRTTLNRMSSGGIRDHLGGGFHRYSTDAEWLVPHFEKMLYDQALLSRAFLQAYRITRHAPYAAAAEEVFAYVRRDLTDPAGAFYAAEDADSDGQEGKFYVWTPTEIRAELGAEADAFMARYGVTEAGHVDGGSILHTAEPPEARDPALDRLLKARQRRVRPHRDDKVLTSWNGLMIGALAYGAATLNRPEYLAAANQAADFIWQHLRPHGRLLRRWHRGDARYPGTLEDYAFLASGLLDLYEAGGDPARLHQARELIDGMRDWFWDASAGGFWMRGSDEPALIAAPKEAYDGATPSGNSVAAEALLRLGRLSGDGAIEALGRKTVEAFAVDVRRVPSAYPAMLCAADFLLGPVREVIVSGDPAAAGTQALLATLRERWLPRTVTLLLPPGPAGDAVIAAAPRAAVYRRGAAPAAYVCRDFACHAPVRDADTLAQALEAP